MSSNAKSKNVQKSSRRSSSSSNKQIKQQQLTQSVFDFDSYSQIHQNDDNQSSKNNKLDKRRSSTNSNISYQELQKLKTETLNKSKSTSSKSVNYHTETRKLKDKNRKLLSEIDSLKQKNRKMNTEMSVANLRQSQQELKKHDYYEKYSRLKDSYQKIMEELKSIKSKHISTLKHKNQLQTQNNSLCQKVKQQTHKIKEQHQQIVANSTRASSVNQLDDTILSELSGIFDIDISKQKSSEKQQKFLLQTSEEKMKLLKEFESKCYNLEQRNRELMKQLRRQKTKSKSPTRSKQRRPLQFSLFLFL